MWKAAVGCFLLLACFLFDPEDGGNYSSRIFGGLVPDYMSLHLRS
jgi:hypothetical protein